MATLHHYFETDFSNAARVHVNLSVDGESIETVILYDFAAFIAYFACFVSGEDRDLDFFLKLARSLEPGKTQLHLAGKLYLPSLKFFAGEIRVDNTTNFQVQAKYFGDPTWMSSQQISTSSRLFIYSESDLTVDDIGILKIEGEKCGTNIQFRGNEYLERATHERPPEAFICHDSRDKDDVAREIATYLDSVMCPVWYDEFSLRVGDNLREAIEGGLRECKRCILVLSPNFFSNKGWTKKEFETLYTREVLEGKSLALPVWYGVSKKEVYEYCPSLVGTKGLVWTEDTKGAVCRELHQVITAAIRSFDLD